MYPIVGTIGYILPLCGEGKTTEKNFAKYFRKEKKQKRNTAKFQKKNEKIQQKNSSFHVDCKILRKYMIICLV